MSRTERFLARRWRSMATLCAIIALFGIASILWARQEASDQRAEQLAQEAEQLTQESDLRGAAVSTLATDVRKLRAQIASEGKTPVAPDPSNAVDDLPDRAEVPVPIPGPKGEKGDPGKPAPTITPEPGASGQPGRDGRQGQPGQAGPTGPAGQPGRDGADGVDGANGADGQDGRDGTDGEDGEPPAGWTYTDPKGVTYTCSRVDDFDPDAPRYECTPASSPAPDPPPSGTTVLGLAPERRRI